MVSHSPFSCCFFSDENAKQQHPPILRTIRLQPPPLPPMVPEGPPEVRYSLNHRRSITSENLLERINEASVLAARLEKLHRSNEASSALATATSSFGTPGSKGDSINKISQSETTYSSFSNIGLGHVGSHSQEDSDLDSDYLDDVVISTAQQVSMSKEKNLNGPSAALGEPTAPASMFVIAGEDDENA